MTSARRAGGLLLAALAGALAAAQEPIDAALAEQLAHALQEEFDARLKAGETLTVEDAQRVMDLRRRVLAFDATWTSKEVGTVWWYLFVCEHRIRLPLTELAADLEHALDLQQACPAPQHRMPRLLEAWANTKAELGQPQQISVRVRRLLDTWPEDAENTPKKAWLYTQAARSFIALARLPDGAMEFTGRGLALLANHPAWSEAEARALCQDPDLWIVDDERPLAGTWEDCAGQLWLLQGYARWRHGQPAAAIGDLLTARRYLESTENVHRLANVRHNLATSWLQLGRLERADEEARGAEQHYAEVVDAFGVLAMRKLQAQIELEREHDDVRAVARARKLLESPTPRGEGGFISLALDDLESWLGDNNADALVVWGRLLLRTPDRDIEGEVGRVLTGCREYGRERADSYLLACAPLLEAEWRLQRGDPARACGLLTEPELSHTTHLELQLQREHLRGRALAALGQHRAALDAYCEGGRCLLRAISAQRLWEFDAVISSYHRGHLLSVRGALEAYRAAANADPAAAVDLLPRLFELLQCMHGYELACASIAGAGPQAASAAADPVVQQLLANLEKQVEDLRGQLASQERSRPKPGLPALVRRRSIAQQTEKLTSAQDELHALRAKHMVAAAPPPASLEQVRGALQPRELLVEFVDDGEALWALDVAGADESVQLRRLRSRAEVVAAAADVRAAIAVEAVPGAGREARHATAAALQRLADALWPAGEWFERRFDDCDVLILAPDGVLCGVPWAAVPWRGRPLVENKAIGFVPSGTLLAHRRRVRAAPERRAEPRLLAFANPSCPAEAVARSRERGVLDVHDLAPLPGTAREALAVARVFAAGDEQPVFDAIADPAAHDGEVAGRRFRVLLGRAARESALTAAALQGIDVVHFACHGRADIESPTLSFLALALDENGANPDDGMFRLAEFDVLRGERELVVLSACETAHGAVRGHEGTASLARGAYAMGARRVLATSWRVGDAGSERIVSRFYELWLRDRLPAAVALARAQREAMRDLPVRDWAAFTLWGEVR